MIRQCLVVLGLVGLCVALPTAPAFAKDDVKITSALTASDADVGDDLRDLNEDVGRDPEDWIAWRDLGVVQVRTGHSEDALRSFSRAESGGLDDPYLSAFHALALELNGDVEAAAQRYEGAAEHFTDHEGALRARAALLRVRAAMAGGGGEGAVKLAVLAPIDLASLGSPAGKSLAFGLRTGLSNGGKIEVLGPAETEGVLKLEGRVMADLDDSQKRRLAGRALHAQGVRGLITSSYFQTESGELHLRLAFLPAGAEGLAEAMSVSAAAGSSGQEFAALPEAVVELAQHAGVTLDAAAVEAGLPTSARALDAYREGLTALQTGDVAMAADRLRQAAGLAPGAAQLSRLAARLDEQGEWLDQPIATQLGQASALTEMLRDEARRTQRRKRRFDDQ